MSDSERSRPQPYTIEVLEAMNYQLMTITQQDLDSILQSNRFSGNSMKLLRDLEGHKLEARDAVNLRVVNLLTLDRDTLVEVRYVDSPTIYLKHPNKLGNQVSQFAGRIAVLTPQMTQMNKHLALFLRG